MKSIIFSLHNHTDASPDSESSVIAIVRHCERIGIDAIAITDHDVVFDANKLKGIKSKIRVIPGVEVSTDDDAHIIGLFVKSKIGNFDALKVIREIHDQNGIAILAHPFRRWQGFLSSRYKRTQKEVNSVLGEIDCVEVYNAKNMPYENTLAKNFFRDKNIPVLGGSDAHTVNEIGNVVVRIKTSIEQLREGLATAKRELIIDKTTRVISSYSYTARQIGKNILNKFGVTKNNPAYGLLQDSAKKQEMFFKKMLGKK